MASDMKPLSLYSSETMEGLHVNPASCQFWTTMRLQMLWIVQAMTRLMPTFSSLSCSCLDASLVKETARIFVGLMPYAHRRYFQIMCFSDP